MKEVKKKYIDLCGTGTAFGEVFGQLKDACRKMEDNKLEFETKDEWLHSVKVALQKTNKDLSKARKLEEKACVDKEQRQIVQDIDANNNKLEAARDSPAKLKRSFVKEKQRFLTSEQALEEL